MKNNKAITSDLFGINGTQCETCNGSGVIVTELVFSDLFKMPCGEREDDCDDCNGNGVIDA